MSKDTIYVTRKKLMAINVQIMKYEKAINLSTV